MKIKVIPPIPAVLKLEGSQTMVTILRLHSNSQSPMDYILAMIFLGLSTLAYTLYHRKIQRRFPPGPNGLPIIGNILDLPRKDHHLAYREWSHEFSLDSSSIYSPAHRV